MADQESKTYPGYLFGPELSDLAAAIFLEDIGTRLWGTARALMEQDILIETGFIDENGAAQRISFPAVVGMLGTVFQYLLKADDKEMMAMYFRERGMNNPGGMFN